MAREPITVIEWSPKTASYKALNAIGRIVTFGVEFQGVPQWFGVPYGNTGGNTSTEAAHKTDFAIATLVE